MTSRQRTWIGVGGVLVLAPVFFYAGYRSRSGVGQVDEEGLRLVREKRYADAVAKYQAVVASDPTKDFAWYQLASASRNAGDCERAVAAYRHYVELAPKRNEPYYGMGDCQMKLGDRAGALASLRRFVANAKPTDVTSGQYVEHAKALIATLETGAADASAGGG
jgi:Flp pilus assembly protein TadD